MQSTGPGDPTYSISADKALLDIPVIHAYLSGSSYWARGRSLETVTRSIEHSLCFGVFLPDGTQVGFARVVTDCSTFAWLCDVFILEEHRGRGLGKRLVEAVVSHPPRAHNKRIHLATSNARELYERYGGFVPLAHPEKWMERPSSDETVRPEAA
jgi:GNAT superfamily N-acetyltransferase